jgi:DNA-binding protein H-NS
MARQSIESRVEHLETRVTMLEHLPERMDRLESQILQLREENREEHSAIRREVAALGTHMRVLHEEVLGRIAALGESLPKRRNRKR